MGVKRVLVENQLAKTRMSKKRIEERTTVPIVLGTSRIEMPAEVATNLIAKEKWNALSKIFHKTEYVTSADAELIAQLCLLYSDVADLRSIMAELPPEGRLAVHAKIDSKARLITTIGEKLFLNPLVRKRGLPPAPKAVEEGELSKGGFDI
jgi:phage terminase small subunit